MSERADRELVGRAQGGDGAAIGELFSRYWRAARAAAFGVTGEFSSAEDAAADAFTEALAGIDSLRDPDRFGAWLRTIVVRKARGALQSRRLAAGALDDDISDWSERQDGALERLESAALIQQAVRGLPDRLREALALVYFEGYDSRAATRFLDIPAGTLRRRLHDGRARLRKAVQQILEGRKPVNEDRERHIERFKSLIDKGDPHQAIREALALRPPPKELVDLFNRGGMARAGDVSTETVREKAQRFLRSSELASNPNHPVGSVAIAIRKALPRFEDWPLDAAEAAARFLTFKGEHRDRLLTVLPPGFAEGRPGAFLRASRAFLYLNENGSARSMYEHLQGSPDAETFRAGRKHVRASDVLDLTWMVAGALELRSVQEMLEGLTSTVLPGAAVRFSPYDEPRYRSALQLHVGEIPARAACGGVLREWPGRPQGVDAAHLRVFLEPWAAVQSGQNVEFDTE